MPRMFEIERDKVVGESIKNSFKKNKKELSKKVVSKNSLQITYKKPAKTTILFRKKNVKDAFQK